MPWVYGALCSQPFAHHSESLCLRTSQFPKCNEQRPHFVCAQRTFSDGSFGDGDGIRTVDGTARERMAAAMAWLTYFHIFMTENVIARTRGKGRSEAAHETGIP